MASMGIIAVFFYRYSTRVDMGGLVCLVLCNVLVMAPPDSVMLFGGALLCKYAVLYVRGVACISGGACLSAAPRSFF